MVTKIGREVNAFINRINRQIGSIVSKYDITAAQAHIINFIFNESKHQDVFQRDIEREFDIRRSSTTNALQLLEVKGLISRESVAIDARLKKVVLTEKGIIIHKKVNSIIIQSEQALSDQLTDDEFATLTSIIEKLSNVDLMEIYEETKNEN
jgi:DNA-binding MarR family transcriptional regulator